MSKLNDTQKVPVIIRRQGFTIVELLIVIVVIGILAAIAIVAYDGIQQRAHAATAQSDANGAKKQLMIAQLDNGSYPTSSANLPASSGTIYELSVNNSASPQSFCLTATNVNVSYKITESTSATAGSCPGHSNNGVAAVTNLAVNPSFESNILGVSSYNVSNSNPTVSDAFSGSKVLRSNRTNTSGTTGPWWDAANVIAGRTYRVTFATRSNSVLARSVYIEWRDSSLAGITSTMIVNNHTPGPAWGVVSGTATAPAGAAVMRLTFYGNGTGVTSDYVDIDGVIITEGTEQYSFADGSSSNWMWNGMANNSTSTGPGL